MGFTPSKAEADIWMRANDGLYEYIAVYVDDLLVAARDPKLIVQTLQEKHKFKLNVVGSHTYHENMFVFKPCEYTSPLEKGDHPEVDCSEELDNKGIKRYQTMIVCLQWAVSLGRFDIQTATMTMLRFSSAPQQGHLDRLKLDIQTATMTMSRFRSAQRQGHLVRLKGIYGYLKKFSSAAIQVQTLIPDLGNLPDQDFDWCYTVYGNLHELIPTHNPDPLGNCVTTVTYTDANLHHDILTGRSVTGILHLCNQTLIDWYSKRQATVETATFGSEFTAERDC
jgi:hypothetical protein